ncbi:hypothetical protein GBA52_007064 [Prunus armeniaca]|nr:hypothetical protein GBA52_007064 [Prunus armeniaca]
MRKGKGRIYSSCNGCFKTIVDYENHLTTEKDICSGVLKKKKNEKKNDEHTTILLFLLLEHVSFLHTRFIVLTKDTTHGCFHY